MRGLSLPASGWRGETQEGREPAVFRQIISSVVARLEYTELPVGLRRYIIAITLLGPLIALSVAVARVTPPTTTQILWAVTLFVLASIAERFPLHLTHKTNINVTGAAYIVMLLLLPAWLPGLLALLAVSTAFVKRQTEAVEILFNIGQSVLYVTAGALVYAALLDAPLGPHLGQFGSIGAIVVAAVVMHLLNTGLVATAGALQLGMNPLRVWGTTLTLDLLPQVTLTALGTIAALLAVDYPLVLPFLALPAVLVHHSVRQTIQLRVDTHAALASLVEVMELRDPYTAGHSHRVASMSRIIALRLGMTGEEADLVEQAGRVHDIGKAGIDTAILTKTSELSDDEWRQMRLHPVYGANVVARFAAYRSGAQIVRHHHEAWDGSGYPDGLQGEQIPLGARILAVVDTYDAMTTDRPYREALTVETAISALERGAGTLWDPRVVSTMIGYLRETHGLPAPETLPASSLPRRAPLPAGTE
jgi:HD-GYP domain-containing protein (c-di-GMP phosphodiesterase class II)